MFHVPPLVLVLFRYAAYFYGLMLVIGPLTLRATFRFRARVLANQLSFEHLPPFVQSYVQPRQAFLVTLGFAPLHYLKMEMVPNVSSYFVLFLNQDTGEWADITVALATGVAKGYVEFISYYSEDLQIDTNNNSVRPMLGAPRYPTYRFPQIQSAERLYQCHKALAAKHAGYTRPVLPPPGKEIEELTRRIDRYAPWQAKQGYLYLDSAGENYRMTWKGAFLGTLRSVWPVPMVRSWIMERSAAKLLRTLGV